MERKIDKEILWIGEKNYDDTLSMQRQLIDIKSYRLDLFCFFPLGNEWDKNSNSVQIQNDNTINDLMENKLRMPISSRSIDILIKEKLEFCCNAQMPV